MERRLRGETRCRWRWIRCVGRLGYLLSWTEMPQTKSRLAVVLEMIKFEHSVFALPFALVGALLAARTGNVLPTWRQILWIVVAMVGARSAAMTMNRIADKDYDGRNPRTANRALPKGELSVTFAWLFTIIAAAVLVIAA